MPVKVIVAGVLGRMGREITQIVLADNQMVLAGCIDRPDNAFIGRDIGEIISGTPCGIQVLASLKNLDVTDSVIIDFTAPEASIAHARDTEGTNCAMVIGTTGMTADQIAILKKSAEKRAILLSPNTSVGVNFLFQLTKLAAEKLGEGFDIEIIEAHHHLKKDSPSGTAVRLAEVAAEAIGTTYDEAVRNGRSGIVGERTKKEIGMHAVRGGDIVGEHTVLFAGMGEKIELHHVMTSRSTLAHGAIRCAKFMNKKSAGWYSMADVLGL